MKIQLKHLVGLIMSVVISLASLSASADNHSKSEYQGKDWELISLNDEKIRLSNYQGQPVLLVFWATWCPFCKKLLPGIQALHEKYSDKGLKIIAVNIREDWKPHVYWRNHEYTFDAVLEGDNIAQEYGIRGTPGLVFIDPKGKVLAVKSFSDPKHPLLDKFASTYTQPKAKSNNN